MDEDDIEDQCTALRKKLSAEQAGGRNAGPKKGLKSHQVHELAKAKIEESERLRKALGIKADYEEGSHWKRQEERAREADRKHVDEAKGRGKDDEDYSD